MIFFKTKSEDPDETPHYVASHQGLLSLTLSHLWDARLKWVKVVICGKYKNRNKITKI